MTPGRALREAWSVDVRGLPHAVGDKVVCGDAKWELTAFDAATGAARWSYPFASHVFGIHGPRVLARGSQGEIHVLDAESGRPEGCIPVHPIDSAVVAGDVLFAHRKASWRDETRVSATDLRSGRRLWMQAGEMARTLGSFPEAFAAGDGAVVAGENGAVLAFDAVTGAPRWRRSWPEWDERDREEMVSPKVGPVFVADGTTVAAVGRRVICLSLADGRSLWEAEGPAHVTDGERVYASEFNRYHVRTIADGALVRKELAGGAPKPLQQLLTRETRVALVADRHAYVLAGFAAGEALIAVVRERGKYAWHHQPAGGHHANAPVAADGRIFYVNANRLICLTPPEA